MNRFIKIVPLALVLAGLTMSAFALNPQPLPPGKAIQKNNTTSQGNQEKQQYHNTIKSEHNN